MKEYTEKVHAGRLLKMLNNKNPCGCCPASSRFMPKNDCLFEGDVCAVCTSFLGLSLMTPKRVLCPCLRLSKKRAIELTLIKLEEKGYLE